jgi:CheY-like chemotaxis protein
MGRSNSATGLINELEVAVTDTGVGIAPEAMNKLYQPFSRLDNTKVGTGLGLVITKRLVELMGGKMKTESVLGKGSTFSFIIPTQQVIAVSPRSISSMRSNCLHNRCVLLVSSNAMTPSVIRALCYKAGCPPNKFLCIEPNDQNPSIEPQSIDLLILDTIPSSSFWHLAGANRFCAKGANIIQIYSLPKPDSRSSPNTIQIAPFPRYYLRKPLHHSEFFRVLREKIYADIPETKPGPISDSHSPPAPTPAQSSKRILVVEDNLVNQKLMKMLLTKLGYTCDIAVNGIKALEVFKEVCHNPSQAYEMIFMDLSMPEMDGITCAKLIRAIKTDLQPIIYGCTANADTESREHCLRSGMNGFLTKPITLNMMKQLLNNNKSS